LNLFYQVYIEGLESGGFYDNDDFDEQNSEEKSSEKDAEEKISTPLCANADEKIPKQEDFTNTNKSSIGAPPNLVVAAPVPIKFDKPETDSLAKATQNKHIESGVDEINCEITKEKSPIIATNSSPSFAPLTESLNVHPGAPVSVSTCSSTSYLTANTLGSARDHVPSKLAQVSPPGLSRADSKANANISFSNTHASPQCTSNVSKIDQIPPVEVQTNPSPTTARDALSSITPTTSLMNEAPSFISNSLVNSVSQPFIDSMSSKTLITESVPRSGENQKLESTPPAKSISPIRNASNTLELLNDSEKLSKIGMDSKTPLTELPPPCNEKQKHASIPAKKSFPQAINAPIANKLLNNSEKEEKTDSKTIPDSVEAAARAIAAKAVASTTHLLYPRKFSVAFVSQIATARRQ